LDEVDRVKVQVQELRPHRRLGRYRLIAELGQGGMGMIHLAVAEGFGGFRKLFVVKELKRELSEDPQFLSLFMREAKLVARLNHANVVHTVEADQEAGRYFLAMEFLDGRPFSEILRKAELAPCVPLAVRLQVICHALNGLHHAHELADYDGRRLEVVHRDVSPANIFVTYDGQVKVLDFGIASAASDTEGNAPPTFKGKIGYAAPEQLRLQPVDRRTDVFACGVVLWEAIALRQLVRGRPSRQIFESRLLGTEPRIAQLIDDVDPDLAAICDRAMSVDPDQRQPSAEALRRELQGFLVERNLSVEPAEIAALMQTKFAHKRERLHRVIEAQLETEEDPNSMVVARGANALGADAAASWQERTGSRPLPSLRPVTSFRRALRSPLRIGLALAALAGAAAWRLASPGATSAPGRVETSPQTALAAPAAASERPSELGSPPEDAGRIEAKLAPVHPLAQPTRRAQEPAASGQAAGARGVLRKRSELTADATVERAADESPAREQQRPPPPATAPAPLEIDLRSVPRHDRRALDLDNPFR
jgi:serine/threonine protein kinase